MKVQPEIYLVKVDTGYSWDHDTEEKFNEAQKKYKDISFLQLTVFDPEQKHNRDLLKDDTIALSKDQIFELTMNRIGFEVRQKITVDVDITQQLIELAEKPIKLIQKDGGGDTYNHKCEVHMPGHSLSLYNEMLLKEDCCTDELQIELNSGWRIIAACPQPDQRRPDYIMGRFNPNLHVDGQAKR